MYRRPVAIALVIPVLLFGSCKRRAAGLDDVPRIAYAAKPGVVRVNAYATGSFRYPSAVLFQAGDALGIEPRNITARESVVDTGAGGSGSGFLIRSDGFILTSGHVVAPTRDRAALDRQLKRNGAIAALVKHFPLDALQARQHADGLDRVITMVADAGSIDTARVVNQVELSDGESLHFDVVRFSPDLGSGGLDLALLSIPHRNLPALSLGDSDAARVGDPIWTVGYPAIASSNEIGGWLSQESDLEATFNTGAITAIKRDIARHEVLQSNAAIYRGNSGGPAIDRNGNVIGIATWGEADAEQIKFLVPVNMAKGFLTAAHIDPAVDGDFNRYYRGALEAAAAANWTEARQNLDVASKLFPNSPDVVRFSSDVDRAIRDTPWWQLHPVAASLSGLVVLGLAAILAVAVLRGIHREVHEDFSRDLTTIVPDGRGEGDPLSGELLGRLTILNGPRAGERLGLGGTGIRIGRESSICEIVLENPKISRLHAEVVSMDGKVLLIDRNSSNGTFVNDQKIDRRFLKDGDIIYFGGRNAIAVAFHV